MIGLQYQAEIPPYLGEYDVNEKGKKRFYFDNIWQAKLALNNLLNICFYTSLGSLVRSESSNVNIFGPIRENVSKFTMGPRELPASHTVLFRDNVLIACQNNGEPLSEGVTAGAQKWIEPYHLRE